MKKIWLLTALCVLILILAACASGSQSGGGLTGSFWALTELNGQPPVAGTGISAQFTADGNVGGSAGCNRYRGTYTASGNKITFAAPLATTMMMCEQAVMDQEAAYLKTLGEAKTFAVKGEQLTLTAGDGTVLAVFQAQSQDLAGSSWQATAFNNGSQAVIGVLEGTTLTLDFDKEGNLSGNAGCNNFTGTYQLDGNQLTVGPLASTMMMCEDLQGVMEQEAQYLAALQSAGNYLIEGNVLELRTKDDALAALFNRK
jgi:heat shock protein HslJ